MDPMSTRPEGDNPPKLEVSRRSQDGLGEIAVAGELDLGTVNQLESAFAQLLAERPAAIVIDLSELQFMDSTGIKTLLQLERRCDEGGVRFGLTEGSDPVNRLFSLTQLDRHFKVFGDREAARAALTS
jgi:anti-sigma B factor antagonist